MAPDFRSKKRSKPGIRGSVSGRSAAALILLLVPAAAMIRWQWKSADWAGASKNAQEMSTPDFYPRTSARQQQGLMDSLPPVVNPRYSKESAESINDPFRGMAGRAMLLASDDPYSWALAAGQGQGRLVVKSQVGGVPTLGPPLPQKRPDHLSDHDILQALQGSAGGSFRSFFARMFGSSELEVAQTMETGENQEENPFSRIRESLSENRNAEKADTQVAAKPDNRGAKEQHPTETKETPPITPSTGAGGTANVVRPYLLMQMGDEGNLHAMAASQPREGALESAEMGVTDFSMLPFPDAAEFPVSIAVADFNGDGVSDVAIHIASQGLLRFFYGSADCSYEEGLRVELGRGPRSLAAGDFDGDGKMDIAVSNIGTGVLTILLADTQFDFRYKTYWIDTYRDYILAADVARSGRSDIFGMTFADTGSMLVDMNRPEGIPAEKIFFDYTPALNSVLKTSQGLEAKVQAVAMSSSLSVNITNRLGQMINVLNIARGSNIFALVGDFDGHGGMTISIATPRRRN